MSIATRKATAADLAAQFGEDSRVEIIHGEMMPKAAPRMQHAGMQANVLGVLHRRFHRRVGAPGPTGWWLFSELHVEYANHELFCHDLCGYRRDRHGAIHPQWPVRVRPDWVLEALSPSHERRDLVDKWRVLHAVGVPHYWIVRPEDKVLQVHRWEPSGYLCVLTAGPGETIRPEPFDAAELRTDVLFGDADDD